MSFSAPQTVSYPRYLWLALRVIAYCAIYWVIIFKGFDLLGHLLDVANLPWVWRLPIQGLVYAGTILLLTVIFRCAVERQAWAGMPLRRAGASRFFTGFVVGGLTLAGLTLVEMLLGYLRFVDTEVSLSGLSSALAVAGAGLLLYASTAFAEEVVFRGYLFQTLGEQLPAWAATVISGIAFAGFHFGNGGFNGPTALSIVFFTLLFVSARLLFDSLWWAIGWHAAWDWMQFSVLGIAFVNQAGHGRALYQFDQTGPVALVGEAPSIEGGLLAMILVGVNLVLLFAIMGARGVAVDWNARPALRDYAVE